MLLIKKLARIIPEYEKPDRLLEYYIDGIQSPLIANGHLPNTQTMNKAERSIFAIDNSRDFHQSYITECEMSCHVELTGYSPVDASGHWHG